MKIISTLTLIAVAAGFVAPNTAFAGDKERALLGGLIGGIIIGAAISDDDCDTQVNVGYHAGGHYQNSGYWEWVSVKTWVPGYYERSCDRYGRTRKVWISGYHTYTKQKVWVEARHASPPSYGRYNDGYRYNERRDQRVGRRY